MAKDKDRALNPAAQQRKLDKAKAVKKGKAEVQARRNEKLARRNPDRLQRQIDDLNALEKNGQIKPREKQMLEELERDLRGVKKARDALGDKAPTFGRERQPRNDSGPGRREGGDGLLGKRRWDGQRKDQNTHGQEPDSGSDTDESVRRIPMPKDTPPPIPRRFQRNRAYTNANAEPLGEGRGGGERLAQGLPEKPPLSLYESKTTYESAPQIRDLRKEAVGRFVPNVVRRKQETVKGQGGLVEPEEFDRLESEGYGGAHTTQQSPSRTSREEQSPVPDTAIDVAAEPEARRLAEEEERFQREMRHVQLEEVEDEEL